MNAVPNHIAFIMDGNGRWASSRGYNRSVGHVEGLNTLKVITEHARVIGVKFVTFYAFSTENWQRPEAEVAGLMNMVVEFSASAPEFMARNVRMLFVGAKDALPTSVREAIKYAEGVTQRCDGTTLTILFNYGGREDLLTAAANISSQKTKIDESLYTKALMSSELPDVDLMIRTGGERRISNFLPWQLMYAELCFVDTLWPDFTTSELDGIIADYRKVDRRFGSIKNKE